MSPKTAVPRLSAVSLTDSRVPSLKPLAFDRMSREQLLDQLDELVLHATRGNRKAIGAIALAFNRELLAEANAVLHNEHDAADVVQDLFLALLEGRAERFAPDRGRAMPFLLGVVRATAQKRRRERRLP
jgi:DNA-directed RNA polymerase specialized sigma24 family protein